MGNEEEAQFALILSTLLSTENETRQQAEVSSVLIMGEGYCIGPGVIIILTMIPLGKLRWDFS